MREEPENKFDAKIYRVKNKLNNKKNKRENMNAAEQLRQELVNSNLFDKDKVIKTVTNGIKNNGGYSEILYYGRGMSPASISYGSYNIECSSEKQLQAIKEYLKTQGFRVGVARHPISYREIGYKISL